MSVASARVVARPLRRRADGQGRMAFWLLLPAAVAVFGGVILYPILRTLLISFFHVDSALATDTPFVGLENYATAVTDPGFWAAMGRTLYFTIVSTAIELVVGLAVAGLLNAKLRARWLFRAIVVIPWALPTIVNAAMWKGVLNAQYGSLNGVLTSLGLTDSYIAWLGDPFLALNMVILADAWKTIPLVAFFLLAGAHDHPPRRIVRGGESRPRRPGADPPLDRAAAARALDLDRARAAHGRGVQGLRHRLRDDQGEDPRTARRRSRSTRTSRPSRIRTSAWGGRRSRS